MTPSAHSIELDSPFMLGDVVVEPMLNCIRRGPCTAHIERQVMLLLVYLAQHAGQPLTRDALCIAVWESDEPNDEALTQAVSKLRRALSKVSADRRIIETIRKVGYRLTVSPSPVVAPAPFEPAERSVGRRLLRRKSVWASAAVALLAVFGNLSVETHRLESDPNVRVVHITLDSERGEDGDAAWHADDLSRDVLESLPDDVRGAVAFVHGD